MRKLRTIIEEIVKIICSEPLHPNVISTPPLPIKISCPLVYASIPNIFKMNQVTTVDIGVKIIERGINNNSLNGKRDAMNIALKFNKRFLNE